MFMQYQQLIAADSTRMTIAECDDTINALNDAIQQMQAIGDFDVSSALMRSKQELQEVRELLHQRLMRIAH